jgi:hypothetical protein
MYEPVARALGGSKSEDLVGVIRKIALVVKKIWLAKGDFVNWAGARAANDFTSAAKSQLSGTDPFMAMNSSLPLTGTAAGWSHAAALIDATDLPASCGGFKKKKPKATQPSVQRWEAACAERTTGRCFSCSSHDFNAFQAAPKCSKKAVRSLQARG